MKPLITFSSLETRDFLELGEHRWVPLSVEHQNRLEGLRIGRIKALYLDFVEFIVPEEHLNEGIDVVLHYSFGLEIIYQI